MNLTSSLSVCSLLSLKIYLQLILHNVFLENFLPNIADLVVSEIAGVGSGL